LALKVPFLTKDYVRANDIPGATGQDNMLLQLPFNVSLRMGV